jgi:hypothetical protein
VGGGLAVGAWFEADERPGGEVVAGGGVEVGEGEAGDGCHRFVDEAGDGLGELRPVGKRHGDGVADANGEESAQPGGEQQSAVIGQRQWFAVAVDEVMHRRVGGQAPQQRVATFRSGGEGDLGAGERLDGGLEVSSPDAQQRATGFTQAVAPTLSPGALDNAEPYFTWDPPLGLDRSLPPPPPLPPARSLEST